MRLIRQIWLFFYKNQVNCLLTISPKDPKTDGMIKLMEQRFGRA